MIGGPVDFVGFPENMAARDIAPYVGVGAVVTVIS